jgi:hypothetical protein
MWEIIPQIWKGEITMKIAKFVATLTIGSLLSAPAMASSDGFKSNSDFRNTYQHEYSGNRVSGLLQQERERHTERNRFKRHLADVDGAEAKLKAQNRYQNRERHQINRGGGDFGRSSFSGHGVAGASPGSGKGSKGRR